MLFTQQFWSELTSGSFGEFAMSAAMLLSAIGSIALVTSIFISLKTISARPLFRYALIFGLFMGMLAAALGVSASMSISHPHFRQTPAILAIVLAPTCFVSLWNVLRIYRCEHWREQ